jgi:hypothetical protein
MGHDRRPGHEARNPVLVTLRAARGAPSLRSHRVFRAVRGALARASSGAFRVVHFSVQQDHLHAIVEADGRAALTKGMRGLAIRIALAVKRATGGGKLWGDRYHARALASPREVRNALVYVLLNFRKHLRAAPGVDPYSSGPWFDGWARSPRTLGGSPAAVTARTWLAAVGWRRAGGTIRLDETPRAPSLTAPPSRPPSR